MKLIFDPIKFIELSEERERDINCLFLYLRQRFQLSPPHLMTIADDDSAVENIKRFTIFEFFPNTIQKNYRCK